MVAHRARQERFLDRQNLGEGCNVIGGRFRLCFHISQWARLRVSVSAQSKWGVSRSFVTDGRWRGGRDAVNIYVEKRSPGRRIRSRPKPLSGCWASFVRFAQKSDLKKCARCSARSLKRESIQLTALLLRLEEGLVSLGQRVGNGGHGFCLEGLRGLDVLDGFYRWVEAMCWPVKCRWRQK